MTQAAALRPGYGWHEPSLLRLRRKGPARAFVVAGLVGLAGVYFLPAAVLFEPSAREPLTGLDTPRFAFPTLAEPDAKSASPEARLSERPAVAASPSAAAGGEDVSGSASGGAAEGSRLDSAPRGPDVRTAPETSQVPVEVVENRYATEILPKPAEKRRERDPFAGVPIVENSYGASPPEISDPDALGHAQPPPDSRTGTSLRPLSVTQPSVTPNPRSPAGSRRNAPAAKSKPKAPASRARADKAKGAAATSVGSVRAARVSSLSGAEMNEILETALAAEPAASAARAAAPAPMAPAPVPAAVEPAPVQPAPVEPVPAEAAPVVESTPAQPAEPGADPAAVELAAVTEAAPAPEPAPAAEPAPEATAAPEVAPAETVAPVEIEPTAVATAPEPSISDESVPAQTDDPGDAPTSGEPMQAATTPTPPESAGDTVAIVPAGATIGASSTSTGSYSPSSTSAGVGAPIAPPPVSADLLEVASATLVDAVTANDSLVALDGVTVSAVASDDAAPHDLASGGPGTIRLTGLDAIDLDADQLTGVSPHAPEHATLPATRAATTTSPTGAGSGDGATPLDGVAALAAQSSGSTLQATAVDQAAPDPSEPGAARGPPPGPVPILALEGGTGTPSEALTSAAYDQLAIDVPTGAVAAPPEPWVSSLTDRVPHAISLVVSGPNLVLTVNGVSESRPIASITALAIVSDGDQDDALTIDHAGGPIPIPVTFDGSGGVDVVHGPGVDVIWTVTGPGEGTVGSVSFAGVEHLVGAVGNEDMFVFEAAGSLLGTVEGGDGGYDTLVVAGGSASVVSTITGPQSGTVSRGGDVITYGGLEPITIVSSEVTITGTSSGDVFTVEDDAAANSFQVTCSCGETHTITNASTVTKLTINAGGGNDTINLVSVDAQFTGQLVFGGGADVDTLTVADAPGAWHITGVDAGSYKPTTGTGASFSEIENLVGAATAADSFEFDSGAGLSGTIDDGAGTLTVSAVGFVRISGDSLDFAQQTHTVTPTNGTPETPGRGERSQRQRSRRGRSDRLHRCRGAGQRRSGSRASLGAFALAIFTAGTRAWHAFDGTIDSPTITGLEASTS